VTRGIHQPVLLAECLDALAVAPGRDLVDGTLGDGGHAEALLLASAPDGRLIGLDRDPEALERARKRLARFAGRSFLLHASFRDLGAALLQAGLSQVDGVLLDLGVSSRQIDAPERGFRFSDESAEHTPLDMRMDPSSGASAADLLARASEPELADWLGRYGELPGSKRLARALVAARREAPLRTVADLRRVIDAARVGAGRRHHPATLVHQALRIAVNDELGALHEGLEEAIRALRPGGRLCVLSYHSLEDRIVKQCFQREERGCVCPPRTPVCVCGRQPRLRRITRKPVRPGEAEVDRNPRARSALLRSAERLEEAA
jgi:16S rRNA (cytosine1402-N4)-methyltransferase